MAEFQGTEIEETIEQKLVESIALIESGNYRESKRAIRAALRRFKEYAHHDSEEQFLETYFPGWTEQELDAEIQKGIDSGPAMPFNFDEFRKRCEKKLAERQANGG